MTSAARRTLAPLVLVASACPLLAGAATAPEPRNELGLLFGFGVADTDLTGKPVDIDNARFLAGLRGALRLNDSWLWFADFTAAEYDAPSPYQHATVYSVRTGPEWLLPRVGARSRFFLAPSVGWEDVGLSNDQSFDRPIGSLGIGMRFLTARSNVWRWEVRAEKTLTDDGLDGADLVNYQALLGWSWTLAGAPADTDGDGILDEDDRCPCSPRGEEIDQYGCPIPKPPPPPPPPPVVVPPPPPPPPIVLPPPIPKVFVLKGVNFSSDSAVLTPGSHAILDKVVNTLNDWPEVRVSIEGHTDSTNTEAHNQDLSDRRAKAVVDYLVSKGIDPARLEWKGWGESTPIADNASVDGRAVNRRVEVVRLN